MGTWIEIRCEIQCNTTVWNGERHEKCFSYDNAGPKGLASDDSKSISKMLAGLAKDAKADGWKRTRSGWICPHCLKFKRPNVLADRREPTGEASSEQSERGQAPGSAAGGPKKGD